MQMNTNLMCSLKSNHFVSFCFFGGILWHKIYAADLIGWIMVAITRILSVYLFVFVGASERKRRQQMPPRSGSIQVDAN